MSKTCLIRFDNNKYSVKARAVGRPVEIHAYADRIVIRQDGIAAGEHRRSFGREETIYDPWHYVPVLARKPGALRNGAPFKDWVLPSAMEKIRRKLTDSADGDRQMVKILAAVLDDGLPAVEAACAEALSEGVHSADVVLNILARRRDPGPPLTILTPDALKLRHVPLADCARYLSPRRLRESAFRYRTLRPALRPPPPLPPAIRAQARGKGYRDNTLPRKPRRPSRDVNLYDGTFDHCVAEQKLHGVSRQAELDRLMVVLDFQADLNCLQQQAWQRRGQERRLLGGT